ncbi:Ankyrin-1, partial [Ananas comosus]
MAAAVAGGETGERQRLDYGLIKALQRGDESTVERFFSQEVSMAIDLHNVARQAGRRRWGGVTVGGNSALHIAADFGHLELAALICARDSSLLRARNVAGETPLHCAARAGADQIVSLFISIARRQEDRSWLEAVLRATDREGKTALHVAAEEGDAWVAEVLMSADPGLAAIDDHNGVSPLYAAVLSESLEVVQVLIGSHADGGDTPEASYGGPNGQTALHAAAIIQSPEIAKELFYWKPELTKKVDSSGSTPLHYLATTFNRRMMRQLLIHDTSPAYFSDSKGLCPIHVAARMGRLPIIRELIHHCPDMGELVDGRGRNFLHVATQHKRAKIVRFICKHPLFVRITNARDCEGNTPLHLAVKSNNQTIVSLLLENMSVRPNIVNKD